MGRQLLTKTLLMATLIAASSLVFASQAAACSCVGVTDSEAFDLADVVFAGHLTEVRTPAGDSYSSADPERFIFAVDRVYKGDARATQSIVTARSGASCGLELSGSGPFLVFARTGAGDFAAHLEEGELTSGLCTGSRALEGAAAPQTFGAGEPPAAGQSPVGAAEEDDPLVTPMRAGVVLLTIVALVGAFAVSRGRRQRPMPA